MAKNLYYNGNKLINQKDINGNKPEIFAVDGNRSDGKTTWFLRYLFRRFEKHGEKLMIVKRFKNQLPNTEKKIFKLIGPRWFPDSQLTAKKCEQGAYFEMFFNKKPCGYVVDLNSAYKLKDISQYFSDTSYMFMDEFQTQDYCPDEVEKFFTLHFSVARGLDAPTRYVPFFMCCNHVSSLNPYYKQWGCASKVDNIEKGFWKGKGIVIERDMNESISELQKASAFNQAFEGSAMYNHAIKNISLCDNFSFVEKLKINKFDYICNCIIDGSYISLVRVYNVPGVNFYFSDNVNMNCRSNFTVNSLDHNSDTLLLSKNINFINGLKNQFDHGYMRFSSLEVKEKAFAFLMIMI